MVAQRYSTLRGSLPTSQSFEIANGGGGGLVRPGGIGFAPAVDALVGGHLHIDVVPARVHDERLNVGDFERGLAGISGRHLGHRGGLEGEAHQRTGRQKISSVHR